MNPLGPSENKAELHSPAARPLVARVGGWELRGRLGEASSLEALRRGLLHLQLWHAGRGVSVLTPNNETGAAFEVRGPCGGRCWPRTREQLQHLFVGHLRLTPPMALLDEATRRLRRVVDVELTRLVVEGPVAGCPGRAFELDVLALQSAALQLMCEARS